jgi:hypothetical protein
MSTLKVSELWNEVEKDLLERTPSGMKMAILEAYKILENTLESKGYPGKAVEDKLFWAGYSLKGKEGIGEALEKQREIIEKFDFRLSDLETEETVKIYRKIINEVLSRPDFNFTDRVKAFVEKYFSPKSLLLWRNLAFLFGFFILVKILGQTDFGKQIVDLVISISDFVISWLFLAIVIGIVIVALGINYYLSQKPKIRIKED